MIIAAITASFLNCTEAQQIINRIDSQSFTKREYQELVTVIKSGTPRHCRIKARPGLYKGQARRLRRERRRLITKNKRAVRRNHRQNVTHVRHHHHHHPAQTRINVRTRWSF